MFSLMTWSHLRVVSALAPPVQVLALAQAEQGQEDGGGCEGPHLRAALLTMTDR